MRGAEDFELDVSTGSPRLIVSADSRERTESPTRSGGLYAFPVTPTGLGPETTLAEVFRNPSNGTVCPLRPHGISLDRSISPPRLYVINHSRGVDDGVDCVLPRDARGRPLTNHVLVYRVQPDGLYIERVLADPRLQNPNDVAAYGADVFVTNTPGTFWNLVRSYLRFGASDVVHYDGTAWRSVVRHIRYPNGILASADRLYVASIFDDSVSVFQRRNGTLSLEREIAVPARLDNLLWAVDDHGTPREDAMYVAGHVSLLAFAAHLRNRDAASAADVFVVQPHATPPTVRRVHHNDGEAVRAASVGLVFRNYLYMGQVFEAGVAVCECVRCLP